MPESSGLEGAMDGRRAALGLTWRQVAERAGISYETLRAVRKGEQAGSELTRRGVERALQWAAGGFEAADAGGQPVELGATPRDVEELPLAAADPRVDAILTILEGLPESAQEEVLRRLGDRLPQGIQERRHAS